MTLTYMGQNRTLSIRGLITQKSGREIEITESDVVAYSSYYGGFEGVLLGSVSAASFTLEMNKVGLNYTPHDFDGAQVQMKIGLFANGSFVYSPFGTWYVDSCSAPEQSVTITLFGYDALASKFEAAYTDSEEVYPTTIGSLVTAICTGAGVRLDRTDFPNAAVEIEKMPEWAEGVTLRDVLSYCAICAGGFAQITPAGKLEILSFANGRTVSVGADRYTSFSMEGGDLFMFNAIEAMPSVDADDYVRFAIDDSIPDNAANTIQLDYNPLLTEKIVNSVVTELKGLTAAAGTLSWVGDPAVRCGDFFEVTTMNQTVVRLMATSLSFTFHGGLSCEVRCELPSVSTVSSATYSASVSQYDSDGNVRVTRIPGLDKKIVSATAGHFESLTADDIAADRLTTALLKAIDIRAGNIVTDSIETDVLTAIIAKITQATIDKINSGTITTDALYAAFATIAAAQITAANIDKAQIKWAEIESLTAEIAKIAVAEIESADIEWANIESLSAEIARIVKAQIGTLDADIANIVSANIKTAEIGYGQIKDLQADEAIITDGVGGSLLIDRLSVTSANMLNATISDLVLKSDDGKYYAVVIGADGTIHTEEVTVSAGEVSAGQTATGQQIVETNMNVGSLNAQNIKAQEAIIAEIFTSALTAGKITAGEAMIASATIPELYATTIRAIGESLELVAGRKSVIHRGENPPATADENDLWVQPSTGALYQLATDSWLPDFYIDDAGLLYYQYGDDQTVYALAMIGDDLYVDAEAPFAISFTSDGVPIAWERVKDGELQQGVDANAEAIEGNSTLIKEQEAKIVEMADSIRLRVTTEVYEKKVGELEDGIEDNATKIQKNESAIEMLDNSITSRVSEQVYEETGGIRENVSSIYSELTQRADSVELEMVKKVDNETLRTYIRYEDGTVELGSSESEYVTQTSSNGFKVLHEGSPMAEMVQNTISAPVIEAKRQFVLGGFSLRTGAKGHLILV